MTVLASVANAMLDAGLAGTVYVGLLVSGTEVSTSSTAYARQPVTWAAASSGLKKNSADIAFPTAASAWGTVNGFALYTASSGGSVIDAFTAGIATPAVVGTGDTYSIATGALTMSMS